MDNNSQVWLPKIDKYLLTNMIRITLQQSYKSKINIVQRVSKRTGISTHTLNKWYQGQTVPDAYNLLTLCQHYPRLLEAIMRWAENRSDYLSDDDFSSIRTVSQLTFKRGSKKEKFCRIELTIVEKSFKKLNIRQMWFMNELRSYSELPADEIANFWGVGIRTARDDTKKLLKLGLVGFSLENNKRLFYR